MRVELNVTSTRAWSLLASFASPWLQWPTRRPGRPGVCCGGRVKRRIASLSQVTSPPSLTLLLHRRRWRHPMPPSPVPWSASYADRFHEDTAVLYPCGAEVHHILGGTWGHRGSLIDMRSGWRGCVKHKTEQLSPLNYRWNHKKNFMYFDQIPIIYLFVLIYVHRQ